MHSQALCRGWTSLFSAFNIGTLSVFLACKFLFVPSDTFAVEKKRIRLAIKRTEKNRVEEAERLPCAIIVTYCVLVS